MNNKNLKTKLSFRNGYLKEYELPRILDNLSGAFFVLSNDLKFIYTNKAFKKRFKKRNRDLLGKYFTSAFAPEYSTILFEKFEQALSLKKPLRFEMNFSHQDLWLEFDAYPSRVGLAVNVTDITHHKVTQSEIATLRSKLEYSNILLDTVFDNAPIGIGIWDKDLRFIRLNKFLAEINGISIDEHIGKKIIDLLPGLDNVAINGIKKVIKSGLPVLNQEVSGETPAFPGELRYWKTSFYPIKVDSQVIAIGGICEEITEQKRHVQQIENVLVALRVERDALQESEYKLKLLSDSVPHLIWITDYVGHPIYYNKRVYEFFDVSEGQVDEVTWEYVIHPDDLHLLKNQWPTFFLSNKASQIEYRLYDRRYKKYNWFLTKSIPVQDKNGKIINWFCTSTNIGLQKEIEERKDEFLSIASHELKTPLTTIKGYAQILERHLSNSSDEKAKSYIARTNSHINRLSNLIADLLDISRIKSDRLTLKFAKYDFDEMILGVVNAFRAITNSHKIIIHNKIKTKIIGDKQRIEQVLENLISNAIKYSPDGKKVDIYIVKEKDTIQVIVQDYGIGISKENQADLFQYLVRAKSVEQKFSGLGIGLYVSSEIVTRLGGKIWLQSEEGHGSKFYFTFPINIKKNEKNKK